MDRGDWVLALLMGSIHFAFHLFLRLVPPLIPVLAVALAFPLWKLGLLVSVYFVGSSVALIPAGVLADRYDRRLIVTGGLALVATGYLLFAVSPAVGGPLPAFAVAGTAVEGAYLAMVLGMFASGLGSAVHVPAGYPIITANADPDNRGTVLGVWGGSSKVGDAAAPAIVGVLILGLAWDAIVLGFAVAGFALAAALFAVLGSDRFDTAPPERDPGAEPVGLRDLWDGDRRRYVYPIAVLVVYFGLYQFGVVGLVTFVPAFVTDVYGYSFTLLGSTFAPESFANFSLSALLVAAAVGRLAAGAFVDRYDGRTVLVATLLLATVGLAAFAAVRLPPVALLAVLVVTGVGLWGNSPARDALISDMAPADREGRTFSYLWTVSRVFGALSPTLIGLVADVSGLQDGFRYLVAATLLAALTVTLLYSDRVYVAGRPAPADAD